MSNDIEIFINLIFMTQYMNSLLLKSNESVDKNKEVIILLEKWDNYKTIQDIINLKNNHINNAIKEVLSNERFVKIIREETELNINDIKLY